MSSRLTNSRNLSRARRRQAANAIIEKLDVRTLLSASVVNGVLTVTETGSANFDVIVDVDPQTNEYRVSENTGGSVQVVFTGNGGLDSVNYSNGNSPTITEFSKTGVDALLVNLGTTTGNNFVDARGLLFPELAGTSGTTTTTDNDFEGGTGNDTVLGTQGADVVHASDGNDLIVGLGGNDNLNGENGSDTVLGAGGVDLVSGGGGPDSLRGGAGADVLSGDAGNNTLAGGGGDDQLNGPANSVNQGNNLMFGGPGNDSIFGGKQSDTGIGGPGDDCVMGGGSDDVLIGDNQDNLQIAGGDLGGHDTVIGGPGNDTLFGGASDSVIGGIGANEFLTSPGATLQDFNTGQGDFTPANNTFTTPNTDIGITLTITLFGHPDAIPNGAGSVNSGNSVAEVTSVNGDTATIHFRSDNFGQVFTLNNFFQQWGFTFSGTTVGVNRGTVSMTVNGQPNTDFQNYVVQNGDAIAITIS